MADCWDEFAALAQLHWQDATDRGYTEPFALDRARYVSANQIGFLRCLTARDHGEMIGYLTLYLTASMHSQWTMAVEDTFFLHPSRRGGRTALAFLRYMETRCHAWGVRRMLASCERDNDSGIKRLLLHLDFTPAIMQYSKYLPPRADSPTNSVEAVHVRTVPSSGS